MANELLPESLKRARLLAPAIQGAAGTIEATRRIPEPLLTELHRSRLLRMLLPRSVGGDEVHPCDYFRATEEVSRHDASIGWSLFVANSTILIAPFLDLAIAREIYADQRALIAWGPPNACRATAAPGGYRVSGRWDFASGCRQATWMGAHCHVVEADGELRKNRFGRPTIRTFLFPADKATLLDTWHTVGLRGTASDSYELKDLFVSEEFSSTREDPDIRREPGRLYAFTMQGLYAVGVAAVAMGTARAMYEAFVELAARKSPRGQDTLAGSSLVQSDVARWEVRLGAARAYLCENLTHIYDSAADVTSISTKDRALVRLATANAIQAAIEVADQTYKAAGVDAIFVGSPFERRFRDIHTLSQQIQSRASHFEAVGQVLLGRAPEVFY